MTQNQKIPKCEIGEIPARFIVAHLCPGNGHLEPAIMQDAHYQESSAMIKPAPTNRYWGGLKLSMSILTNFCFQISCF